MMLGNGLEVFTPNRNLQINNTYKNLALLNKKKLTDLTLKWVQDSPFEGTNTCISLYSLTPQNNEVCYALGCKNKNKILSVATYDGRLYAEQYTPTTSEVCFLHMWDTTTNYASDAEIDVYTFGIDDARIPEHGVGLCVYDENENPVYYSDDKSLRIVYSGTQSYFYGTDIDVAIVSTLSSNDEIGWYKINDYSYFNLHRAKYCPTIDNGTAFLRKYHLGDVKAGGVWLSPYAIATERYFPFLLVDVTGY